ncbi:MAG: metal ABC transporter permease [Ignavibacteriae bacterium]|nr:metal ABC transporter permease [Ignavibacteriota bacterium]
MNELFYLPQSMLWPLVSCLVLTGIHVYLGVHVIARKVIFVDLALAQIAALGTVVGVLLGYEVGKDANALYLYSLAFTIFGAFVFSITRMKAERVPHEAIIGIVYAVTFATTILVLSKSALGPAELDHIIKGELLWVQPPTVIKTAIIYALVGLFHFIFRKKFMAISVNHDHAEASGMNVRLWDFLFYMSFGFVITSSVAIAGVFLVFSYLVIPSVGAMLLSDKLSTRLTIGWVAGSIISFIGVKLSWNTGLPTSPLVVVLLACALVVAGLYDYFKHTKPLFRAVRNLAGAVTVVLLFLGGVYFFRAHQEDPLEHTLHMLASPLGTDRLSALSYLESFHSNKEQWIPLVIEKLKDEDAQVRKSAIVLLQHANAQSAFSEILSMLHDKSDEVKNASLDAIKLMGDSSSATLLIEKAQTEDDPELQLQLLTTSLSLGSVSALPPLLHIIQEDGIFAEDAWEILKERIPFDFDELNVVKIETWLKNNSQYLKWNVSTKVFELNR